jgi:outer membrane protein assembly factor BamD (BamD/ComL family)
VHIKEQREVFERFRALWTPTQLILDSDGHELFRIEGFLPTDDFLAQLELGLAKIAFEHHRYDEAERRYRSVCERFPETGAAPEACYWEGVSAYKATNDPAHLRTTAERMKQRYPQSEWARKASVWEEPARAA